MAVLRTVLSSWKHVVAYVRAAMAHERTEQFRILFLDKKNQLIKDEVQQRGTVDHAPVYPREVVKRALELGAGAVILAHNHPSGIAEPSRADEFLTRSLAAALQIVDVRVLDHLVVGQSDVVSFAERGLL